MALKYILLLGLTLLPALAQAGAFEVSFGLSYNRSKYSGESYTWNRRWGGSVGYHLTELSEIEFSYTDVTDRTHIVNYEDTTFHDQIYSASVNHSLLDKNSPIQPYVKFGVGQLNRKATGNYAGGSSPPSEVDSVTVVLGGGIRIYLTKTFALRTEFTSYLTGGAIKTWKDNIGVTFGGSIYF